MNCHRFTSILAIQIEKFIRLRQLSGTDYTSRSRLLLYFDRFLVQAGYNESSLTRHIIEKYYQSISSRLSPSTLRNRMSAVRQLCLYLTCNDKHTYVPEQFRMPSFEHCHQPYIYSPRQIENLLTATSKLTPAGSLRPLTYKILLGLLYSTGLRINEALHLDVEHFLSDSKRLFIRRGKFRKERWIVLSDSTHRILQQYMELRLKQKPRSFDSPIFLNNRNRRLNYTSVSPIFRLLITQCGIAITNNSIPRIHDLRHTFAVHRLLAWYRDGHDIHTRLPALATYMGHVSISSTQIYLRPTAELFNEVLLRFHTYYLEKIKMKGEEV